MLANIGKENPAKWIFSIAQRTHNLLSFSSILFKEQDMTPCRRAESSSVVVRISRPRKPVVGDFVPFFTRDLASFAADADGRIGEESDLNAITHVRVSTLVCAL